MHSTGSWSKHASSHPKLTAAATAGAFEARPLYPLARGGGQLVRGDGLDGLRGEGGGVGVGAEQRIFGGLAVVAGRVVAIAAEIGRNSTAAERGKRKAASPNGARNTSPSKG